MIMVAVVTVMYSTKGALHDVQVAAHGTEIRNPGMVEGPHDNSG